MAYSESPISMFDVEFKYNTADGEQQTTRYVLGEDAEVAISKAKEWANDGGRTFIAITDCRRRAIADLR
jgi:hypothetical protein